MVFFVFGRFFAPIAYTMEALKNIQKTRIINWEIPYLIFILEKKYKVASIQIVDSPSFSDYGNSWFSFDGNTGFPLFMGDIFLGVLICFQALESSKAQEVKRFIDNYLQKVLFKISWEENSSSLVKGKKTAARNRRIVYPLLLERETKTELLKLAYNMYLKSSCFAFLNTEDLKWERGIFRQMKGVFVCVPSFQQLSFSQKEILIQDLSKKPLSCHLVLGIREKEALPSEWKKLFYSHCVS